MIELLTPKKIMFDAIKSKMAQFDIHKLTLIFNIETDVYSVLCSSKEDKTLRIEIQKDEITLLKKMLINKITRKLDETQKGRYDSIIIQINIEEQKFEVFYHNKENKDVYKFEF